MQLQLSPIADRGSLIEANRQGRATKTSSEWHITSDDRRTEQVRPQPNLQRCPNQMAFQGHRRPPIRTHVRKYADVSSLQPSRHRAIPEDGPATSARKNGHLCIGSSGNLHLFIVVVEEYAHCVARLMLPAHFLHGFKKNIKNIHSPNKRHSPNVAQCRPASRIKWHLADEEGAARPACERGGINGGTGGGG